MKLQQFNGGLNTRLAPQLLQVNKGVEYTNINIETGVLEPLKDKLATSISLNKYAKYFSAEDTWVSKVNPTQFVEFQGFLYYTDGIKPKKLRNGIESNLGITNPSAAVTLSAQSTAATPDIFSIADSSTGGDLPYTTLQYCVVSIKDGISAIPYKFSVTSSAVDRQVARGAFLDKTLPAYKWLTLAENYVITAFTAPSTRKVTFNNFNRDIGDKLELYRKYNNKWYKVGEILTQTGTIVDDTLDISANAELSPTEITPFNGTYQYVYTYYNSADGTESAPSPVSEELEIESGFIRVSGIVASTDSQVDKIKIYRVGGLATQFSLVDTIANATTSYDDTVLDSEMDELLEAENYYAPPSDLKYISESYAMLFGASGSTLYFTPIGVPNAWPPEYSIEFNQEITGLGSVANGLLVMTRYKTYVVTGTGPLSLVKQLLRGDQGCVSYYSIQEATRGTLVWASEDGLCGSSGSNVESITKGELAKRLLTPVSSAVDNEVYYCLNSDGTTLVWDYRFTPTLYELELAIDSLATANGKLYGIKNGLLYELFASTSNLVMQYKSPRYVEGSLTVPKVYKKVYFSYQGDIIINIIIDNLQVASFELSSSTSAVEEVQVPQDCQRGFSIQFEVSGTGKLEEIEYLVSVTRDG